MKKRTMIFLAAVLTITAAVFTSCVTQHNGEYINAAQKIWLVGSLNDWNKDTALEATQNEGTYTFEYTYTAAKTEEIQFKVFVNEKDWKYAVTANSELKLDTPTTLKKVDGKDTNTKLKVEKDKKYKFSLDGTEFEQPILTVTEAKK